MKRSLPRTFARCRCHADCVACRVPPRRAGNFHLVPQMKVTKAKRLNAKPFGPFFALCMPGPAGHLDRTRFIVPTTHSTRPRFASALGPAYCAGVALQGPRRRVRCGFNVPRAVQVARRTEVPQRAKRTERCCVEGLCFGDFHLAPQMKVTRPPGRDPARWQSTAHQRAAQ